VSVNDEVVHGIPGGRILQEGDIVGLDVGLKHKGLFVDMAETVPVGHISDEDKRLIDATREALFEGIKVAVLGSKLGAIGNAIEKIAQKHGFGLVREFGGHGVGHAVHEEPYIPNFGSVTGGPVLREGMVLALEPMFVAGKEEIDIADDEYTVKTRDGRKSAHFEHTIAITETGPVILTE
jgi:methionyl aminopeptidase